MKKIQFTVIGNQEDKLGNPLPYFRRTQGSKFSPQAKRYWHWLEYVQSAFFVEAMVKGMEINADPKNGKPIAGKPIGRVDLYIRFANENHGDPDNIAKGVLDALFSSDKHIDVNTYHVHNKQNPGVDITINLIEE